MLIILIILLILFVLIHGTHCIRWLRKKDHLSLGCLKRLCGRRRAKDKQMSPDQLTHANPHTHSPKLHIRRNETSHGYENGNGNVQNGRPASTVFSVSGKFLQLMFKCLID